MNEIIEFVNSIIDSYQNEAEINIHERSSNTTKDLKELEIECKNLKEEFISKLSKYGYYSE